MGTSGRVHITVNGTTHDVTDWLAFHPGGSQIIQAYAGRDATDAFMVMHSQAAYEKLERMAKAWPDRISKNAAEDTPLDKDFRKLDNDLRKEGLYRSSKLWYTYKITSTICIGILAALLVTQFQQYFVGAVMLGLMFQQFGWLAHDVCHHEAFADRKIGDVFGLLCGAVANGFSPTWWKNKHNTHHAATNILTQDPDIDNLPFLAFDVYDVERATIGSLKMIEYQSWYFHPLIAFLKFSWCWQSICFVAGAKKQSSMYFRRQQRKEAFCLTLHYSMFFLFLAMTMPSILKAVMFFLVSELAGGYFIAIVVLLNHMHMPKLDPKLTPKFPEWVRMQLSGTVNVRRGIIADWFFGGLNYQIEHHLFPNFPRHRLGSITPRVKELCKKYDVPYRDPPFFQGVCDLMEFLNFISKRATSRLSRC